jgi:hypothetical protein
MRQTPIEKREVEQGMGDLPATAPISANAGTRKFWANMVDDYYVTTRTWRMSAGRRSIDVAKNGSDRYADGFGGGWC